MSDSFATLLTVAHRAPPSGGYWNGLPFSSPADLPDPGIKLTSPMSPGLAGGFFTTEPPGKSCVSPLYILNRQLLTRSTSYKHFLLFSRFPSHLLMVSLRCTAAFFFFFYAVPLIYFSFSFLVSNPKKSPRPMLRRLLSTSSLRSYMVSGLTFISLIHFELIFYVYYTKYHAAIRKIWKLNQ